MNPGGTAVRDLPPTPLPPFEAPGVAEMPPWAADGPILFARYAYPPNELGYCGPDGHRMLLEYAAAHVVDPDLSRLARGFEGAWPYLELIAGATGIGHPLDRRVVEAYWLGNGLLRRVDMQTLGLSLMDRFRRRAGSGWSHLAEAIPQGALPIHSFHVFGVYPFVGLLRAGHTEQPLHILDRCRIRWGRVLSLEGDQAVVASQPLTWDGRTLALGAYRAETVTRRLTGMTLAGREIGPGDWVSMHWDWVCDRLSRRQLVNLRRSTLEHLEVTNRRVTQPGVAAVLS